MKNLFLFLCLIISASSFCQTLPNYDEVELESKEDFKAAEVQVRQAVEFLLATPIDQPSVDRNKLVQFLNKWMMGTPDYSFALNQSIEILGDNVDLIGLYMAAMTKFSLENPTKTKDLQAVKLSSWKILLAYCDNAANNVKMSKKLKKLSEANQKGELEKSL